MRERESERERERERESIDKISQEKTHTKRKKNPCAAACARTQTIPGIVDKFAIAAALP
jgi:hypothetical protein